MRSTRAEAVEAPRRTRSLTARVALASGLAAALGGAWAALAAGLSARQLVVEYEAAAVLAATRDLALEIDEELNDEEDEDEYPGDPGQRLGAVLAHELSDVKLPGARAALVDRDGKVIGDATLPAVPEQTCERFDRPGAPERVCAVPFHSQTLRLGVSAARDREQGPLFVRAVLVGLGVGAVLGLLASYAAARWSLAPLAALVARVRSIDTAAPRVEPLEPALAEVELEALRGAVAQLVARLAESLSQAQAFAAEAAHELRTPLSTVAGELELLTESCAVDDRPALARVAKQVAGLIELTQRLLLLAQPARLVRGAPEAVDLAEVVLQVVASLPASGRERVAPALSDDVLVRGDPALLRALVGNGLGNALKFAPGPVEVRVAQDAAEASIDIVDQGPGIVPADRERVFAAFYRAPEARAAGTPGHGVGLALIAHVAKLHGGHAEFVDSAHGAHLRVRLPRWSSRAA